MEMLAGEGCSVLAISLRGHGDSAGRGNDIGYGARRDVAAAVAYLEQRRPGRAIVVHGTSLGAAAAIYAAGDLKERVGCYILEAPYRDIYTAVRNRTSAYLPRPLGFLAFAGLVGVSPLFLPDAQRMAPVERIADIPASTPILLLAGGRDDRSRPEEMEEMQARVSSHARLINFDGAGHEALRQDDPARYREQTLGFIRDATGSGTAKTMAPATH
jgi:alpha-beta hydrolase superfamily lysophospholipase